MRASLVLPAAVPGSQGAVHSKLRAARRRGRGWAEDTNGQSSCFYRIICCYVDTTKSTIGNPSALPQTQLPFHRSPERRDADSSAELSASRHSSSAAVTQAQPSWPSCASSLMSVSA